MSACPRVRVSASSACPRCPRVRVVRVSASSACPRRHVCVTRARGSRHVHVTQPLPSGRVSLRQDRWQPPKRNARGGGAKVGLFVHRCALGAAGVVRLGRLPAAGRGGVVEGTGRESRWRDSLSNGRSRLELDRPRAALVLPGPASGSIHDVASGVVKVDSCTIAGTSCHPRSARRRAAAASEAPSRPGTRPRRGCRRPS